MLSAIEKASHPTSLEDITLGTLVAREFGLLRIRQVSSLLWTMNTCTRLLLALLLLPLSFASALTFPTSLRDEIDLQSLDASDRKIVVLIHGWNPNGNTNSYSIESAPEFAALVAFLKTRLAGKGWSLVTYRWESDAATGGALESPLGIQGFVNASQAATNAYEHGLNLASVLTAACPNLEKVHIIAHSAGSWAGYRAMGRLLATSSAKLQLTLLDPFMPSPENSPAIPNSNLSVELMGDLYAFSQIYPQRIHLLENYFAFDLATDGLPFAVAATSSEFAWRSGDINKLVDYENTNGDAVYRDHSGPIQFFGDTVYASNTSPSNARLSESGINLDQFGWRRSLFFQEELSRPTIAALTPSPFVGLPLPQTRLITITGTRFTNSSLLTFSDGINPPYSNRVPQYISQTELRYEIATGPQGGTWTVQVSNDGVYSSPHTFSVTSAPPVLSSLTLQGAATVNEGSQTSYTATAQFDNGSTTVVTTSAVWSENSTSTTIDSGGVLSAGSVSSDTSVTISASYTYEGVTRTASKVVTVINSGGSGPQNVELIVNGGFESGTTGWTLLGPIVKQNGSYPRSGSNYAILGETDNTVDVMYQQFTIPANATSATLNYYLNIVSAENTSAEYDIIETSLRTTSGNLLQLIEHKSNINKAAGPGNPYYVKGTLNLMPWAGQTVRFHVLGQTDSNTLTSFKLDDVSAVAVIPGTTQPTNPEIEITGSGEVIPHGGTATSPDNNTDFGKHTMEQTTALRTFRVYNRGDGTLNLTGNPKVRIVGSSSFTLEEAPSSNSIAAGIYVPFKIRFNPLSGGIHNATVRVESDATNISEYTFAIKAEGVFFDGTAPVVTISSPTSSTAWSTTSNTMSLSGSASDNHQVSQVSWSNDRGGGGAASGATSWSAGGILLKSGTNVLTVTALDGVGNIGTDSLTVTYTPTTPEITVQPESLSQHIARGSNGTNQTFTVRNTGSGTLNYTVSVVSGATWLSASPSSGANGGGQDTITVSYNTSGLAVGTHTGSIQVAASGVPNSPVTIPVTVNVTGVPPTTPWVGTWAATTNTANVVATAPTQSGGTVLFGAFSGTITAGGQSLTASGSALDVFAVKLDANNQVVWVKQFGGVNEEDLASCQQHPAGGWVISGHFKSTASIGGQSLISAGNRDAYLARLDEDGNVLWAKRGGGTAVDYGERAMVDGAGNCFLAGKFTTSATFTGGSTTLTANGTRFDLFVAKYSSTGTFVWAKSVGGSQYDDLYCAAADAAGNVYLGGIFEIQAAYGPFTLTVQGSSLEWDGFVAKFNSNGDVVWAKRFGEPSGGASTDHVDFIAPGPDGSCWIGGGYDGPMNADGFTLPASSGIFSGFVGKVSAAGAIEWLKAIPANGTFGITRATNGVVVPADNSLVFGGTYSGPVTFGSSSLPQIGAATDPENIYFAKIDASGTALWAIPAYSSANGSRLTTMGLGSGERVKFAARFDSDANLPGIPMIAAGSSNYLIGEIGPPVILSPPTISDVADQTISEDSSVSLPFTIGDDDTPLDALNVSVTSSVSALVPQASLVLSGTGSSRQLMVTPVTNGFGTTTISLVVSDGAQTATDSFVLTVNSVNDLPSTPVNVSPVNSANNQWTSPLLEAGSFSDLEGDAHSASEWQVLSEDGQVIVWDSGEDSTNKTSRNVATGALEHGTTYRWRVRYKDNHGGWSTFSASTLFKTIETFGSYQQKHFTPTERNNPALSAITADADGDGLPNLLEYAFGSDPRNGDSDAVKPTGAPQGGHLTFTYVRRTDAADLAYVVEMSDDLINWDSQPGMVEEVSVVPLDANRERVTVREATPMSSRAKRFVRLSVRQQ